MSMDPYQSTDSSAAGIGALFDLSFSKFVTVSLIRVIYLLAIAGLALFWFVGLIGAFVHSFLFGVGFLIVGTVVLLLYLLMIRVWLEVIVVVFKIAENTSIMAGRSSAVPQGFPVMPVQPPQ